MARESPDRRAHRVRISRYLFDDGHNHDQHHDHDHDHDYDHDHVRDRDDDEETSSNDTTSDTSEGGGIQEETTIEAFARRCLAESRRIV